MLAAHLLVVLPHPIDQEVPGGVDFVFDGIGGPNIGPCIGALRRGGTLVAYGFMAATGQLSVLAMFANLYLGSRLRGRRGRFYGITMLYRKNPKPFREDLPKIFALLEAKHAFALGMPHIGRRGSLEEAIEFKTLRQYTCLGLGW